MGLRKDERPEGIEVASLRTVSFSERCGAAILVAVTLDATVSSRDFFF
ncbi:MAG TPA: hypothetical protein VL588_11030 [Bdellovibrionota bacterium]|nr:hypothetical protein [Bdellovibrionota bacterium]